MTTLNNQSEKQTKQTALFAPREAHQPEVCNYSKLSDLELLGKLIGVKQAQTIYSSGGSLNTLFAKQEKECIPCNKNLFQHRKARYKGLAKNTAQLFSLFGFANLVLARRWLRTADSQVAP